jgi:protein-tyrosine phosphatase
MSPQRDPYRIVFVCLGNICRSPMAEVVTRDLLSEAGLADRVAVSSAGTGDWHIGERADRRTLEALAARGYDGSPHRARWFEAADFDHNDLVVALDHRNLDDLRRMAPPDRQDDIRLLREYDVDLPAGADLDVPDPYYGGPAGFDDTLRLVEAACRGLVAHVANDIGS